MTGDTGAVEIALHTRLRPGAEEAYERIHAVIPADLDAALREAGVLSWRIWRDGLDLFHLVRVVDPVRMRRHLRDHPANQVWQQRMAALLDVPDTYDDGATGLGLVWKLP
ncbi:L-rhamnose mutarotase [Dactylosporangium sp. NPDC006015]|uniref:L-rhamnose mutarotase n=1 Tax=Dactylosporangium sp. NPDC006015 TaxID=3154576 RepID=UPI0033ABCFAC